MSLSLEQMKANRKLWVEALRSGKYKQTQTALKRADGSMCCLGVLCELAGCDWTPWDISIHPDYDSVPGDKFIADGKEEFLATERAMSFVGLRYEDGSFGLADSLASENDGGAPFAEIANIIESEPTGLFIESEQP